ncbi:MAG TPA: PilZ domain-containing protein [Smithellaceae bacterium]|nr:PilZ domain-containing protein [Smithellaceae bacterium]
MTEERRKRTRVPVGFEMAVIAAGKTIAVKTTDISLAGVRFQGDLPMAPGSACMMQLRLQEDLCLNIEGTLLRVEGDEAVVSFLSMDEETFYHLKRLVQLNASDADRIDQEIQKPAFSS